MVDENKVTHKERMRRGDMNERERKERGKGVWTHSSSNSEDSSSST